MSLSSYWCKSVLFFNYKYPITLLAVPLFYMFSFVGVVAQAVDETDFYIETNHLGVTKNFVVDYGGDGQDVEDDSEKLQNAIDELTQLPNGGKITIPAGIYYLAEIRLKSNVHIEIDKDATIIPSARGNQKNYKLFYFDGNNSIVKNASIRGVNGSFKVDLRNLDNKNVGVFSFGNVENFFLANFEVVDDYTKFSAITFGISTLGNGYNSPLKGVIKNATTKDAHYGYGLIQTQAARDVLFKNISGSGGVTLRFETGYDKMNELQVGGVFNMVARNVSCENGNAALMISPHAIHNGKVDVEGVTANNCGFAVRIGKGYVRKDQEEFGLTPGTFEPSSVRNISATYGFSAQLKSKHIRYMSCDLRDLITEDLKHIDEKIYSGPSIASVLNGAEGEGPGKFVVAITNASSIGFDSKVKDILYEEDIYNCSGGVSSNKENDFLSKFTVFPNPFINSFTVRLPDQHSITTAQLLNLYGLLLAQQSLDDNERLLSFNVENKCLPENLYLLRLIGRDETVEKKIIKRY